MTDRKIAGLLALAIVLPVGACSRSGDPADPDGGAVVVEAAAGRTFELGPNETARITGLGILVAFRGVAQDSRCPTDVTCVWEGDASLRIRASSANTDWTPFDLHTSLDPRSARIDGHTITVVGLTPSPVSDRPIANDRYRVTLRVE